MDTTCITLIYYLHKLCLCIVQVKPDLLHLDLDPYNLLFCLKILVCDFRQCMLICTHTHTRTHTHIYTNGPLFFVTPIETYSQKSLSVLTIDSGWLICASCSCLLAVCTTDSRVKLYREPFCDYMPEWVEVDLNSFASQYCLYLLHFWPANIFCIYWDGVESVLRTTVLDLICTVVYPLDALHFACLFMLYTYDPNLVVICR